MYKDDNLYNKALELEESIPNKDLIKYINILINSFFDYEFESNLNISH